MLRWFCLQGGRTLSVSHTLDSSPEGGLCLRETRKTP